MYNTQVSLYTYKHSEKACSDTHTSRPVPPVWPVWSWPHPSCSFGKTSPITHTFQASWFNHFAWLHYDDRLDRAFCFTCCKAVETGKVKLSGSAEPAFTNWKDATRYFSKRKNCDFHKSAAATLTSQVDIREILSKQYASEKQANQVSPKNSIFGMLSSSSRATPQRWHGWDQLKLLSALDASGCAKCAGKVFLAVPL